jgi:hypothetical protein
LSRPVVIVLLALLLSGCAGESKVAPTPEEAVRQHILTAIGSQAEPAKTVQILGQRQFADGMLVVSRYGLPGANQGAADAILSADLAVRQEQGWVVSLTGGGWEMSGGGTGDSAPGQWGEQWLSYRLGSTNRPTGREAFFYGQTLAPQVAAVEATFSNGQTLRDHSTDGVFALRSEGANAPCRVRVLNANGELLQAFDFSTFLPPEPEPGIPHGCAAGAP